MHSQGTKREKLEYLFQAYDLDKNGARLCHYCENRSCERKARSGMIVRLTHCTVYVLQVSFLAMSCAKFTKPSSQPWASLTTTISFRKRLPTLC